MAEAAVMVRLREEFQGITLWCLGNHITVDVPTLNVTGSRRVTIITDDSTNIVTLSLNKEQGNVPNVVNGSIDERTYNIGDVLPDGWIVGPVSSATGKPTAIEPVESALEGYQTWYEGEKHAQELRSQGHAGVRLPDENELNAIYKKVVQADRNQRAQFNRGDKGDKYWSSTPGRYIAVGARMQSFADGVKHYDLKGIASANVRCIRDELRLMLA